MKLVAVAMIAALFLVGGVVSVSQGELFGAPTFNGSMVETIDRTGLNITILIVWGRARISMLVVNSDVLKGVTVKDWVRLEPDQKGRVVKIATLPGFRGDA